MCTLSIGIPRRKRCLQSPLHHRSFGDAGTSLLGSPDTILWIAERDICTEGSVPLASTIGRLVVRNITVWFVWGGWQERGLAASPYAYDSIGRNTTRRLCAGARQKRCMMLRGNLYVLAQAAYH